MKNNYYKLFLLLILISSLYNNGYCQEIDWNTINDNEEWDVLAYKRPVSKRNIALSLSMLQKALINSEIKPEKPLPITKVNGLIIDDETKDIIILGIEESGDGVVKIVPDDIVLAMQTMLVSDQPPGMSIDPVFDKGNIGPFQNVVYFGGIENTRAGLYAFNCDYWMKQLAAGKINVPLKEFSRYVDLVIAQQQNISANKGNRFWFYPKKNQFSVSPDYSIMLSNKSGVEVLTEEQHILFEERKFDNLYSSKKIDPFAKEFTDQLTSRYNELSTIYPDLAKLKNFFALCEVFKWVEKREVQLKSWKYLLYEYSPIQVHTPKKADTVKVVYYLGMNALFLIGGVQVEIRLPQKPFIDKSGQLNDLKKEIFLSKPSKDTIYWEYFWETSIGKEIRKVSLTAKNLLTLISLRLAGKNITTKTMAKDIIRTHLKNIAKRQRLGPILRCRESYPP